MTLAAGVLAVIAGFAWAGQDGLAALAVYGRRPAPVKTAPDLRALADAAAREQGVDPCLLRAVVARESGWNPRALGTAGEIGLVQMLPSTWRFMESRGEAQGNPWEPEVNLRAGAAYLRYLGGRFSLFDRLRARMRLGFDRTQMTAAAYNWGEGKVAGALVEDRRVPPIVRGYAEDVGDFQSACRATVAKQRARPGS